ncbi:early light-induced protein 1, chloroplastic-like [Humulus lupulus]|uniref:early light-induced protein 1, chloroplastic-like n=1 Tax=Humulus lupulus TaxID=3486 RepID=UPI002B413882|nr:early light-induced protein 1, chloroplastic-like [Humulus lupulus]
MATMQSLVASTFSYAASRNRTTLELPKTLYRNSTHLSMRVRCMAEDGEKEPLTPITESPPPQAKPAAPSPPKPKMSTRFTDVLAFSGPAPERINGRLAMVGFMGAMAMELSKGQDVFAQISNGGGSWFVGTSIVLTLASLVPLFKGVSVESKSDGVMTSDAELLNGRVAMVGLVALALTEYVKGGTIV